MTDNISILKRQFTAKDIDNIDPRIRMAMEAWHVAEDYRGGIVRIPGTWNSEIYPYKYFEIYKIPGGNNPGESENEIQLYLSCGWRGTDDEVVIVLKLAGTEVLDGTNNVHAEIYKFGSAKMKVFRHNKLVTNFTRRWWKFWTIPQDKVVVKL